VKKINPSGKRECRREESTDKTEGRATRLTDKRGSHVTKALMRTESYRPNHTASKAKNCIKLSKTAKDSSQNQNRELRGIMGKQLSDWPLERDVVRSPWGFTESG